MAPSHRTEQRIANPGCLMTLPDTMAPRFSMVGYFAKAPGGLSIAGDG